jgi:hypothetical protein
MKETGLEIFSVKFPQKSSKNENTKIRNKIQNQMAHKNHLIHKLD